MLLVTPEGLAARRDAIDACADLRALEGWVRARLRPLVERPPELPRAKPLLSRDGGVCPADGARLVFDPRSPDEHRCPRCGRRHRGERHHRAWIWRFHLWLSERAIHLALLAALRGDVGCAAGAAAILGGYAKLYPSLPNRDNVLGPTRLFFSTYLESIWLVQVLLAASLLERAGTGGPGASVRRVLAPVAQESARLIASFDEGLSNRQVWNAAALIAAGQWLPDDALAARGVEGRHGFVALLERGVTADGLWFEGENYHFFALRGFLLAAELLRAAGRDPYGHDAIGERLAAMYLAPLATLLPDLTLPARGDAPFGVSVRQPRFAELWEIGRARTGAPRLESLLAELYDGGSIAGPDDDTAFAEIAEQETNRPARRVARCELGWKALLWMMPEPPSVQGEWRADSGMLPAAGVAVLRPRPGRYVSLECGGAPGGHGHADVLHLSLFDGAPRLADFGTGSYVTPSLHWYRSTLAHNAPGLAGAGQRGRDAWCAAFDARDGWAWCRAAARELLGPNTMTVRTLLAAPEYVVDVIDVVVSDGVAVDLPVHVMGGVSAEAGPAAGVAAAAGGGAPRDPGYALVTRWRALPRGTRYLPARGGDRSFEVRLAPRAGETLFIAEAPGPPDLDFADGAPTTFLVRRTAGPGRWVQLYVLDAGAVQRLVVAGDELRVTLRDGVDRVGLEGERIRIDDRAGRTVVLGGALPEPPRTWTPPPQRPRVPCARLGRVPPAAEWLEHVTADHVVALGGAQYRRSEAPHGPDGITARAAVFVVDSRVGFAVEVVKRGVCFRPAGPPGEPLDNEAPDIHSDGIQCFVGREGAWAGYVAVPEPGGRAVQTRPVRGTDARPGAARGEWVRTRGGYRMVVTVETGRPVAATEELLVSLVVNEMYPKRTRRAGQLVLAGEAGWVYLRGDREQARRAARAELT